MRYLFLLLAFSLSACQTSPPTRKAVYEGGMTYPETKLNLGSGLTLTHLAGAPVDSDSLERPSVGPGSKKTHSYYELRDAGGQLLGTAASMLYDPKYDSSDFQEYNRQNDRVSVHLSPTGNSILIVEDRSPTFPNRAYILLQRRSPNSWSWTDLRVAPLREKRTSPTEALSIYAYYPSISAIDDNMLFLNVGKAQAQRFSDLATAPR